MIHARYLHRLSRASGSKLRKGKNQGFGLVEAMVAAFLLMAAVAQAVSLFFASINASERARLRDGLNAAINADLEQVRNEVAGWAITTTADGQLAYLPATANCANATLGTALLAAKSAELPSSRVLDLSAAPIKLRGITVNRTIAVVNGNSNLIQVSYATASGSPINMVESTTLSIPAQGWCP
jgi:Tfp pilus assembly protein PilV